MKQIISLTPILRNVRTLCAAATLAVFALGSTLLLTPLRADSGASVEAENTQIAAVDQLLADFHGALSYGGNINAMMNLWVDDPSITLNGVAHVGKTEVQNFFLTSGYFLHNWVSLAPEYKTTVNLHGNTGEVSTQCVAVDLSTTPPVVRSVIQVNAIVVKHGDHWMLVSMDNTSGAPL
jgi:hypothetical protein